MWFGIAGCIACGRRDPLAGGVLGQVPHRAQSLPPGSDPHDASPRDPGRPLPGLSMSWGFVDFGPGPVPFATVNLGGDRGFTLNFLEQLNAHTAAAGCIVFECPPGAPISLNAGTSPDLGGRQATLNGVSYHLAACCPPLPSAFAHVEFTGQTVAPPFGDFTKAILTVPVEFSGTFSHRKPPPAPTKGPRKPLPEELARDAIGHEARGKT